MDKKMKKYKFQRVSIVLIIVNILIAVLFVYGMMRMSHSMGYDVKDEAVKNINGLVENLTYQFGRGILNQDMITGSYGAYIEDEGLTLDDSVKYLEYWKDFYTDVEILDLNKKEVLHLNCENNVTDKHNISDENMKTINVFLEGASYEEGNARITPCYTRDDGKSVVGFYREITLQGEPKILLFSYDLSALVQRGMSSTEFDVKKGLLTDENGEYLWGISSIPKGDNIRVLAYTIPHTPGWTYTYYVDLDEYVIAPRTIKTIVIVMVFFVSWFAINLIGFYIYKRRIGRLIDLVDEQNEQLRHASDAKTAFVSNISHEIRTPINTVLGMDEMIIRESTEPVIAGYARDIQKAGRLLLDLINDVLDFSKIESGKLDIIPVEYKPEEVISNIYTMARVKAAGKYLDFEVLWDENIPMQLYGDDIRIRQCIINLLTNAIKYTEKGSVKLRIDCREIAGTNEVELIIKVTDTGIGIKSEDMQYLFEDYHRLDEEHNRAIEGTGLGLPMVSRILGMMESKLEIESVYGEGSSFGFRIRQKIVDRTPSGRIDFAIKKYEENHIYAGNLYAPDARILIIDDTALNLKVVESLLKQTAINIDAVLSGTRGIELCALEKYDLILVDHRMPGMDGIQFVQNLRATEGLNANTPVVALTANVISGAKEKYLSEGFEGFIAKPINPGLLEDTIKTLLPSELIKEVNTNSIL